MSCPALHRTFLEQIKSLARMWEKAMVMAWKGQRRLIAGEETTPGFEGCSKIGQGDEPADGQGGAESRDSSYSSQLRAFELSPQRHRKKF